MRATLMLPLLAACSAMPSEADLYGLWANLDMGTVRGFEFARTLDDPDLAGETDVYRLYVYEGGSEPVVVQKGLFSTERYPLDSAGGDERPALVQDVVWAVDASQIGQTYGNEILSFHRRELVLYSETAFENRRVYGWVNELP